MLKSIISWSLKAIPVRGRGVWVHRWSAVGLYVLALHDTSLSSSGQSTELSICMLATSVGWTVGTSMVLTASTIKLGKNWRKMREERPETGLGYLN